MQLFEQKQKLLQIISQNKLNGQMYLQALDKLMKSCNNDDINIAGSMEMEELKQFYEGNVEEWYKNRIEESK